jgi:hypothetical protein
MEYACFHRISTFPWYVLEFSIGTGLKAYCSNFIIIQVTDLCSILHFKVDDISFHIFLLTNQMLCLQLMNTINIENLINRMRDLFLL